MLIIEPFAGLFASGFSAISFLDEQLTCSFAVCTLMCRSAHMASRVLSAQLPPGVILILLFVSVSVFVFGFLFGLSFYLLVVFIGFSPFTNLNIIGKLLANNW